MIQLPPNTRPQFSGHETFPLRQLWLRKAYDAVSTTASGADKNVFSDEDAIARFGVGKNMVTSMRFWATACQVIEDDTESGDPWHRFSEWLPGKDRPADADEPPERRRGRQRRQHECTLPEEAGDQRGDKGEDEVD